MDRDPYNQHNTPLHHDLNSYNNLDSSASNPIATPSNPEPITPLTPRPHNLNAYKDEIYFSEPVRQQRSISTPRPAPYSLRLHTNTPEKTRHVQKRNFGTILVSILLYLWALACSSLGIYGILAGITPLGTFPPGAAPSMVEVLLGLVFLLWLFLNTVSLILLLIFHKHPRLRWWVRFLCTIATTVTTLGAFFVASHFVDFSQGVPSSQENVTLGSILFISALILGFIALF